MFDQFDLQTHLNSLMRMPKPTQRPFELENIPDKPNPFVTPKMPFCAECSIVQTDRQCRQCNVPYCERCYESNHSSSRVFSQHELLKSSLVMQLIKPVSGDTQEMCKHHEIPIDHLCQTCSVMICLECGPESHEGHSLIFMSLEVNFINK